MSTTLENAANGDGRKRGHPDRLVRWSQWGIGVGASAGRGWCSAASGRAGIGVGRSTVARALACDRPPKDERPVVPTAFTPFEPLVRRLLATTPDMPATVIAERVGWTVSITWFRDNVALHR